MQIITGTKCNPVTDIIDVVPMKITKKTFSKPLKSQKHKVITYFACNNGNYYKFRQLVPLLTDKDVSLIMRERLYSSCVLSSMLYGSETCPVRKENVVAHQ